MTNIDDEIEKIIEWWDFEPMQDEDRRIARIHNEIKALVTAARIDENRIIWDLPRDKGLVYFEEHIQKRFKKLDTELQQSAEQGGSDE
jgi:hypothetical protein